MIPSKPISRRYILSALMILFYIFGCTEPCGSKFVHGEQTTLDIAGESWTSTALQNGICGPAFIHSANIDDDLDDEILISNFNVKLCETL